MNHENGTPFAVLAEMTAKLRSHGLVLAACTLLACSSSNGASPANPKPDDASLDAGTRGGAPIDIAIPQTARSAFQTEPTVAVAPNGTVAIAWIDFQSTPTVGFTFSPDRGESWSEPQLLSIPNGAFSSNEGLVADANSNFYLVTMGVSRDQKSTKIFVGKAAAGTTTFAPLVEASDASSALLRDASALSIAQDQSLLVTYVEYLDSAYDSLIVSSRSIDGGATWTRSTLKATGVFSWTNGCASRTSAKVAAVFVDNDRTVTSVRWSDDNGATWPEANTNDIAPHSNLGEFPSCVADGNELWVMQGVSREQATRTVEPTLDAINLSHSSDGGHTFDAAVQVQDAAAGTKYMRALATVQGDGSLSLVYYAGSMDNDKAATVRRAISRDRGRTFAASEELFSPVTLTTSRAGKDWLGDLLGAASDAQSTFVSFVDNSSGASHIRFARRAQ